MRRGSIGAIWSRGQVELGGLAVAGFFVLSGFLITGSGVRLSTARFVWNRAIRILPGLWVCLLVTAFVIAPLVARREHLLDGFWSHPQGPWQYVLANWSIGTAQPGISGLLTHNADQGFNGSLWSLAYEVVCYLAVASLAALGILRRARWAVPALVVALYCYMVYQAIDGPGLRGPIYIHTSLPEWRLPFLGSIGMEKLVPLGLLFGLGAVAELYKKKLPMNGVAALLSFALLVGSARYGGFYLIGLPALAYLLIWLACCMPGPLTRVGAKADLSYGVYIYAFPIQQGLALWQVQKHGYAVYTGASVALALVAAALSWYLVEKPALKLKSIGLPRKGVVGAAGPPQPAREPATALSA
ncbi:acyltransferase [Kitasatospora purpeofusca]|uniref:acyltransferase family protein n=1 Tax=Kitasatospora purpeofusca TaxID=67352 RepID=UPI002A5A2C7E|nr:acyltransferase [Kitasatospora purpeofusca]MDY0814573.1 acyltransferase [Kitasatospora purpeofusca]